MEDDPPHRGVAMRNARFRPYWIEAEIEFGFMCVVGGGPVAPFVYFTFLSYTVPLLTFTLLSLHRKLYHLWHRPLIVRKIPLIIDLLITVHEEFCVTVRNYRGAGG